MISASDFRNGVTIEIDGNVCQIIEFQHVKPGKGAAFVRTKLKDIINGGVKETTFRPTEKFPAARIDKKDIFKAKVPQKLQKSQNKEKGKYEFVFNEKVADVKLQGIDTTVDFFTYMGHDSLILYIKTK